MDGPYIESLHADRFYGSSVVLYKRPSKRVKMKRTYTRILIDLKTKQMNKKLQTRGTIIVMIFGCAS